MTKRRPRTIRKHTTTHARRLRTEIIPAEKKLWRHLRNRQMLGLKFRRQQPIGRFIVDFFCPAAKVVVEIDGDSHAEQEQHDASRTNWLEKEGYHVVRILNSDVRRRLNLVLYKIAEECRHQAKAEEHKEE